MTYADNRPHPIEIETDFFEGASDGVKFGVALTRHPGSPTEGGLILPREDEAAIELVRQAYIAGGIIDQSEEATQELRRLDNRSERFAVMQRLGSGAANVIATAKLVRGTPLPMQELFPWIFDSIDPDSCLEMSQLACCHPDRAIREVGFLAVLRAVYGYSLSLSPDYLEDLEDPAQHRKIEEISRELGLYGTKLSPQAEEFTFEPISTVVAMTEDFVFERVADFGISTIDLGGPLLVQEARDFQTKLYPVGFDLEEIRKIHLSGANELFDLYLERVERHLGLGWFGEGIIENLDFSSI